MNVFKRLLRRTTKQAQLQMDPGSSEVLSMLMPRHSTVGMDRGTTGMLQSYSTSPWVRAAVSKIGDVTGSTRWYLFAYQNAQGRYQRVRSLRDRKDGSMQGLQRALSQNVVNLQGELREITDHPYLRLMDGSNPVYPGHVGRALTQNHIDLTGEAYWLLDPMDNPAGVPENYWIIPPHWVTGLPSQGNPYWEVHGPEFSIQVPVGSLLRYVNPDPLNPYRRGSGHLRSMGDEIDVYEFASKHIRAWFKNRAIPDILVYGENIDSDDTTRLEQHWTSKLRGFTRSHLPLFLRAKGINVKELSQKFSDMELSTLKKDDRDTIIHGLGFPPEIFGILESSNRSTIDAADYLFMKYVILPRLELQRAFMQTFLLPRYDDRFILAYESPLADDREFQLEVMKAAPTSYRVNDWRSLSGHEQVDEEDNVFMVPYTMQPRTSLEPVVLPVLPAAEPPPALPAGEGEEPATQAAVSGVTPKDTQPCTCGCQAQAQGLVVDTVAKAMELIKQVGGTGTQELALQLSDDMQAAVLDAWMQLRNHIDLRQLEAALENGTFDALLADLAKQDGVYDDAIAVLRQAVAVTGDAAAAELGAFLNTNLSFELTNPAAVAELERIGAELVTNVSDETIAALRTALTDAYNAGRTNTQVAMDIREMIGLTERDVTQLGKLDAEMAERVAAGEITEAEKRAFLDKWTKGKIRYRAQLIAENELNFAGNSGQQLLWEEAQASGLMPKGVLRQWVVAFPCEICAPMAGVTTGLNQPWQTPNGKSVMIPTQTHVRCKCTFVLVFPKT
jgi:hypothetical protein